MYCMMDWCTGTSTDDTRCKRTSAPVAFSKVAVVNSLAKVKVAAASSGVATGSHGTTGVWDCPRAAALAAGLAATKYVAKPSGGTVAAKKSVQRWL